MGKLGCWKSTQNFIVADIQVDIFLQMEFLQHHTANLCFCTASLRVAGHALQCEDESRLSLYAGVQVIHNSESAAPGRLNWQINGKLLTIEQGKKHHLFLVGTTVVQSNGVP